MNIKYKTNSVTTTKSMTEFFFGREIVNNLTASAIRMSKKTGETKFKFWNKEAGYLTIIIEY